MRKVKCGIEKCGNGCGMVGKMRNAISENERYLPVLSIPGAGNTIAIADPAVITNFRL